MTQNALEQEPRAERPCPLCGSPTPAAELREAAWASPNVVEQLAAAHPAWKQHDGACPACVQQALLQVLLTRGEDELHESVQRVWPLDAAAAFGTLPTPLRLHGHPRYAGSGVTLAFVDSAFYPHPDLVTPENRIRAWVDASRDPVTVRRFDPKDKPRWPGWDARTERQWHGLMTSTVAAGNGALSHGLYRGLASEARVVLVQVMEEDGHITNAGIARAFEWLLQEGPALGVRVVNASIGGDALPAASLNPVDDAVAALVEKGISVVAAAGNDGVRRLVPPGTAPEAVTVGGLDDKNTFDHAEQEIWRSNYGETEWGTLKPELVAPSLWVTAPLLPGTSVAEEARDLFARRGDVAAGVEQRLAALKLVTPHYQHAEGTSFATPLVSSTIACMLEAYPELSPHRVRDLLLSSAHPVPGASVERQGAGALDAGRAVALALVEARAGAQASGSPHVGRDSVDFTLDDRRAGRVRVLGTWNRWEQPGEEAQRLESGLWKASLKRPPKGHYFYKFLIDDDVWLSDPANPERAHDGQGGWNSVFAV